MAAPPPAGASSVRSAFSGGGPLARVNPLAKVLGPLPPIAVVLFTPGLRIGAWLLLAGLVTLLGFGRIRARTTALLLAGLAAMMAVITVSLGIFARNDKVRGINELFEFGGFTVYLENLHLGLGTALRMAALLVLVLVGGMTTTAEDLVKSMIRYLRMPYRIGYAALAAYRFVPRFRRELELVRSAHAIRGIAPGKGPAAAARRRLSYAIPLLAGAIRHGERVALAMDARAFGLLRYRTERSQPRWRSSDTVFVLVAWAVSAGIFVFGW